MTTIWLLVFGFSALLFFVTALFIAIAGVGDIRKLLSREKGAERKRPDRPE